jgi:hypothetical protein
VGRLSLSPRALFIGTVATAIAVGGSTAALVGGSTVGATTALSGPPHAVTCSQGSLRNLKPNERTTFTCPIPNGLIGDAFVLYARVGVFNAGSAGNYARTNCQLSDGKQLNSGGDDSPGAGGIALQLPVNSTGSSFTVTCSTQGGTAGAQITHTQLSGIAIGTLAMHTHL